MRDKYMAINYIILLILGTKTRKYSFMLLQSVMFHLILVWLIKKIFYFVTYLIISYFEPNKVD